MDSTTFTTAGYGILDPVQKTFSYARAGHNPLILYNSDRHPALITYSPKGTLIGMPWALNCENANIKLMSGDILFQYTDGITEAKSKAGEEFGFEKLCEVIEQVGSQGATAVANAVKRAIGEFSKGSKDADDVTMVIIEVK
jgi:sigma-B regulation protein RsbU (phosphoserine phosphatase)